MSTLTYAETGAGAIAARPSIRRRLAAVLGGFSAARKARRDFLALSSASDHILSDIGLTRGDLNKALAAPFWVNPSDRLGRRGR